MGVPGSESGSEKQQKYKELNEKKVELNQMKQNLACVKLKETDPVKAEAVREANRKRKAAQRERKNNENKEKREPSASQTSDSDAVSMRKSMKSDCGDLSDVSLVSENEGTPRRSRMSSGDISDVSLAGEDQYFAEPAPSRQHVLGKKMRGKNDKVKSDHVKELMNDNNILRNTQDRHDDLLTELDFRIQELEVNEDKYQKKIKDLEEQNNKNTDKWFVEVYKNLNPDCRREVRNAFAVASPQMEKGTILRLRKNTGINFSNPTAITREEVTELKQKVLDFAEKKHN